MNKKTKLARENAVAELEKMVECFGFNISTEITSRVVKMDINDIPMEFQQDVVDSGNMVDRIMEGKISFDAQAEEIVYHLSRPIKTGENKEIETKELRFGQFTRGMQKATKVPLNRCNFATLPDEDQDALIKAMTGVSDDAIMSNLTTSQFNDLRMIGGFYLN